MHTLAVMQTRDGLFRVAASAAQDLAADGVVYAEVRYAPEQHLERGLYPGGRHRDRERRFSRRRGASSGGWPPDSGCRSAHRDAARGQQPGDRRAHRPLPGRGVSGFDIAGAEAGYPPTRHLDAFEYLQRENAHFTIHAGEAFGLPSIWEAIQWCGADRLGHGVRIVDDITRGAAVPAVAGGGGVRGTDHLDDIDLDLVYLGLLAAYVRDLRIPLEMCPSSNLQTGAAPSIARTRSRCSSGCGSGSP